ncbi:hypothetical protein Pelo_14302 [Pelomyxa schiedti]|nr:hypothetical protein Pelo_14302 [Pelomyxa schiedti]
MLRKSRGLLPHVAALVAVLLVTCSPAGSPPSFRGFTGAVDARPNEYVTATINQPTVVQGQGIWITGRIDSHQQMPLHACRIAVFVFRCRPGAIYRQVERNIEMHGDGVSFSFRLQVPESATAGKYAIVVQYAGLNGQFDEETKGGLVGFNDGTAEEAMISLLRALNSPYVDDLYTKLLFLVEVPVIRILEIGDRNRVGDAFEIIAITNLNVGSAVTLSIHPSSYSEKGNPRDFVGIQATTTVVESNRKDGINKIAFDVDSSSLNPDEYFVSITAITSFATGTALFVLLPRNTQESAQKQFLEAMTKSLHTKLYVTALLVSVLCFVIVLVIIVRRLVLGAQRHGGASLLTQ